MLTSFSLSMVIVTNNAAIFSESSKQCIDISDSMGMPINNTDYHR